MAIDTPPSATKKAIGYSLLGCGGLLVLLVGLGLFVTWRAKATLNARRAEIIPLVTKFADCFYRDDAACLTATTLWDDKTRSTTSAMASQAKQRLGARGKASPIDKSWRIQTFKRVTSTNTTSVHVAFNVEYERDPKAIEIFDLFDDGSGFRVKSFHINSPILFVDSTRTP